MPESDLAARTEVDLALRAITARFPAELAAVLLPPGVTGVDPRWIETQVAARERRLDRLLAVQVGGEPRWLHVEWMLRWERGLPRRMFEYHALATLAAFAHSEVAQRGAQGTAPHPRAPRIESTVVLLSGREAPWPAVRSLRTSPRGAPWCGVRFRVEPVYQRTLAQLRERGSLWLLFAPLACDATPEALRGVVADLRAHLEEQRFVDLTTAMVVLADADGRRRGLAAPLAASLPPEVVMKSAFLQEIRDKASAEAFAEGQARGEAKAILTILEARGIAVPDDVRAQIESCFDPPTLDRWLRRAAVLKSARAVVRKASTG